MLILQNLLRPLSGRNYFMLFCVGFLVTLLGMFLCPFIGIVLDGVVGGN